MRQKTQFGFSLGSMVAPDRETDGSGIVDRAAVGVQEVGR
jgi:hypothetical protein